MTAQGAVSHVGGGVVDGGGGCARRRVLAFLFEACIKGAAACCGSPRK